MSSIGIRLQKARMKKGFTQKQLAEKLQCGDKAISCYENDKNLDKVYDFIKICQCLDVDINYIITGKEYTNGKEISQHDKQILSSYHNLSESFKEIVDFILNQTKSKIVQEKNKYSDNIIKLFDIGELIEIGTYQEPVSAGYGNIIDDSTMKMQFYPQTKVSSQADYCVIVSGDSMFPLYEEGDVLFVKSTNILRNNDIGIFFYDDETVCKRYNNENNVITLISENIDKYKPRIVLPEKLIIRGKVLGKYHID